MGISSFIKESRRILKLATKPSRKELWLSARITVLAMLLVGMLSFIVQVFMIVITGDWGTATT
ncbi:MAG: protein translocase SEC61 complex subunit gamma [Candidatus Thorarchaeota archaeon]|nr:protein translocase SEC61 complex subunit gamma [Candidatus Thorarchaeota archaeon]